MHFLGRGQLNIPLHDGTYLTNLALRENYLHVQLRSYDPPPEFGNPPNRVTLQHWSGPRLELVDTLIDFSEFMNLHYGWTYSGIMNPDRFFEEMLTMPSDFTLSNVVDLSVVNMTTSRPVDNQRYTERIYRLSDPSIINYLEFQTTEMYMETDIPVFLSATEFSVPPLSVSAVEISDEIEVDSPRGIITLRNMTIRPTNVSFTMRSTRNRAWVDAGNFEIYFLNADGTESRFHRIGISAQPENPLHRMGLWELPDLEENFTISLSGDVIDLANVVSVRVRYYATN